MPEALVWQFTRSALLSLTSRAPTVHQTVLCPCCVYLIIRLDMLIKEVVSAREASPFTSNLGMRISLPFWNCAKTTVTKVTALVICSTPCGFQTCLWSASSHMEPGLSFVPMNALVFTTVTGKSSRNCMSDMNEKARPAKPSRLINCGSPFWILRSRLAHPTCCTRTPATPSRTKSIPVSFSAVTCALKLCSTQPPMKQRFATWQVFLSPNLCRMTNLTLKLCERSQVC
mmetsp:Transcript_18582/g.23930  ORF Transcript_18582/g.23930 Transcript_18582/m.23930 type:complete len:229 (-) Transcript_18582:209-895(-)